MVGKPEVILFDLDGTLLDNSEAVIDAYESALARFGLPAKNRQFIGSLAGLSTFDTAKNLGVKDAKAHLIDEHFWEFFGNYAKNPGTVPLVFPEVQQLLSYLKDKGIKMGIVTSNARKSAEKLLTKAGLSHFFYCMVGAEDVDNKKPSADPLIKALRLMDIIVDISNDNSSEIWMVGDTIADIGAAKNIKIRSIAIPQNHTYESVKKANADIVFNSMADFHNYVRNLW